MLLPTINWDFVARHKGYMDAANGGVWILRLRFCIRRSIFPATFHVVTAIRRKTSRTPQFGRGVNGPLLSIRKFCSRHAGPGAVLCCAVLCCALRCAVCCAVLCCAVLCGAVRCCAVCCAVLCCP